MPKDTNKQNSTPNTQLRLDILTMAMSMLNTRLQKETENQQLLPPGRQQQIIPYSSKDLIKEANILLNFVTNKS